METVPGEAELDGEIIPEFRDDPTSDIHGAFIAYADVVHWIAGTFGAIDGPEDEWDIAEKAMRTPLEAGDLVAYGHQAKKKNKKLKPISFKDWPSLYVDLLSGQPEWDREEHGGREYGNALRRDPADGEPSGDPVWTGICFRKKDILRHWPKPPASGIPPATAAREHAAIAVLTEHFRQPENAKLTRKGAAQYLESKELAISERGLEERVLPRARTAAGLSKNCRSGRPPKAAST